MNTLLKQHTTKLKLVQYSNYCTVRTVHTTVVKDFPKIQISLIIGSHSVGEPFRPMVLDKRGNFSTTHGPVS